MKKQINKYLNKYAMVRKNAFVSAVKEGYFNNLTKEEYEYLNNYEKIKPTSEEVARYENNPIMDKIFTKYDIDTNVLIDEFCSSKLDYSFHIGYYLYFYKEKAYDNYIMNNSLIDKKESEVLKKICKTIKQKGDNKKEINFNK